MNRVRSVPWALLLSACLTMGWGGMAIAQQTGKPSTPAVEPLRTAVDRPFDIRDIRLELRVDLPQKSVEGTATLQVRSLRALEHLELDAVDFQVKKVTLASNHGEPRTVPHKHDGKRLIISLDPYWPAEQEATLRVEYRVENPKDGLRFFGPTPADPETPLIVWSQGEPTRNRYWFPCSDEPDQRQTTEIVVTVPEGFEAISNGKLLSRRSNPDKTVTFDWRQDKSHPAYLVTLVVGQFDVVREDWDTIPVLYYVPKGKKDQVASTFGRTRDMLSFFSKRFGIHYPWDKYAQVAAFRHGGAMENTSATTLGDNILQDRHSVLDSNADGTIAHELAHQWWGDLVTCRDWAHLWLNEGFASYAEALWEEHKHGTDAYAYNMYQKAGWAITAGKKRPVVDRHYGSPRSMFDGRAYPKGAWILHMLRRRVGEEGFWKGVQKYGSEHRLQSAETADFRRAMERVTGRNLERFFYDWTERAGNPVVEVTTDYMPSMQQARVVVKQTQPGEPFHFPLTLSLRCRGADKPVVIEQDVTDREYTFLVPLPGTLTLVEVDPDQAVLAEIKETKPRDLWAAQLLQASGATVRLRAVQHFRDSKKDEDRELLAEVLAKEKFRGVLTEIASVLGTMGGDRARDALVQGSRHTDPRVRRACIESLGKFAADAAIAAAVEEVLRKGDASYAVCTAAMNAYVKHKGKDAVALLSSWLSRPSHNDILRASALTALARTQDLAVLNSLLTYAKPGNPRDTRGAALRGMIQLVQEAKPNEEQRKDILAALTTSLEGSNPMTQLAVINALGDLGSMAVALLPTVEKLSRDSWNAQVRTKARQSVERIRDQTKPATTQASAEVKQLREEVERLKHEQAELLKRLEKIK
jgi:aminopeptidase N